MKCETYLQADAEVDKMHDKLNGIRLSKEIKETVDEFLNSYIYLMTLTVELAYRQGMKDLADFTASLMDFNIEK